MSTNQLDAAVNSLFVVGQISFSPVDKTTEKAVVGAHINHLGLPEWSTKSNPKKGRILTPLFCFNFFHYSSLFYLIVFVFKSLLLNFLYFV